MVIRYTQGDEQNVKGCCGVCGKNMRNPNDPDVGPHGTWPEDWEVYHCQNGVALFCRMKDVHHTRFPTWGNCWNCGQLLGCTRCTETYATREVKYHLGAGETPDASYKGNLYSKRVMIRPMEPGSSLVCSKCRVFQSKEDLLRSGLNAWVKLENHPQGWIDAYQDKLEFSGYEDCNPIYKIGKDDPLSTSIAGVLESLWNTFQKNQKPRKTHGRIISVNKDVPF